MASENPAFILKEYTFSITELKIARTLNLLQIQYLHTKRAHLLLQKAGMPCPENVELDRSYLLQRSELDGKINLIQELLDDHEAASKQEIPTESGADVEQRANAIAKQS